MGALQTSAWRRVRQAVLERDGYLCRIGGPTCTRRAQEVDHIIPRKAGGAMFDEHNLRSVCKACHAARPVLPRHAPNTSRNW